MSQQSALPPPVHDNTSINIVTNVRGYNYQEREGIITCLVSTHINYTLTQYLFCGKRKPLKKA